MLTRAHLSSIAALGLALASCGGPPCRSQSDCDFGSYCVLTLSGSGQASGTCVQDCLSADDCPQPMDDVSRAVCTNEGRCRMEARSPRLRVLEPEVDTRFPAGTRRLRVSGEVESAADRITIEVGARTNSGCFGGPGRTIVVDNPNPGAFSTIPFVADGIIVDPGLTTLSVVASVQGSRQSTQILVEVPCEGCATITVDSPTQNQSTPALELPRLAGRLDPPPPRAIWRVHSTSGDVFDGPLPVSGDRFDIRRLPLFAGSNRVEVVVSGQSEARCSTTVVSGVAREAGLRLVMTWDGETSDLDAHLLGPGGLFGDPVTTLTARSPSAAFGGEVLDDFDGLGPEVLTVESLPDGDYGVIVEPVTDAEEPGSNVFFRVLYAGRTLTAGPVGPEYLSAKRGELWVAGAVRVSGGTAQWRDVDEIVPATMPPMQPPAMWPVLY